MFSQKTRKMWAIALAVFLLCSLCSALLPVFADEPEAPAPDETDAENVLLIAPAPAGDQPAEEQPATESEEEPDEEALIIAAATVLSDISKFDVKADDARVYVDAALVFLGDVDAIKEVLAEIEFQKEYGELLKATNDVLYAFVADFLANAGEFAPDAENAEDYKIAVSYFFNYFKTYELNLEKAQYEALLAKALPVRDYMNHELADALIAGEEEFDGEDIDKAIAFLALAQPFDADGENETYVNNYKAIGELFVDSYTDVVKEYDFKTLLDKAIPAKRDSVKHYNTWLALLPPIIAIGLALITKEVYSSLFIGILSGAFLYSNFNFTGAIDHAFANGFIASVADSYNIGIIIFLIVLGAIVALMNQSGGSAAFGRWASTHIKSKVGAQCATILLGILIFVDDYFNCLTVGSVMRPVSDKFKVSRAKLAYLIDATAAPICIIAPVSSWAAAVAGFVSESEVGGFELFLRAIPYNFYALLTIIMMFALVLMKFEYGPMKKHELNAQNGDLFSSSDAELFKAVEEADEQKKGIVLDLLAPVIVLIVACVLGLLYSGGFFESYDFIDAFSGADASVGLVLGSFAGLIFSIIYYLCRRTLNFKQCMESIPAGFKAMVPAIMILACAWTLKTMTDSLGAKVFIAEFVRNYGQSVLGLLPAVVFLIATGLAFATGTSWGTFGILIPIVLAVFGGSISNEICVIAISACMAGAVCGDHCSPISDTTIMASAGSQSNHLNHVSTQLPYALTVAGVSFVCYLVAGFVPHWYIMLPIGIVLMLGTLFGIKALTAKKN